MFAFPYASYKGVFAVLVYSFSRKNIKRTHKISLAFAVCDTDFRLSAVVMFCNIAVAEPKT